MKSKWKLLILVLTFVLLGGLYWGVGNTPLTVPVTYLYYALCLVLSVLYLLVSGGLSPIRPKKEEKKKGEPALLHPVKKREKYRRFTVKKEEKPSVEAPPPPNPLNLSDKAREKWSTLLLLLTIPFYLIFLLDFLYLRFFI